MADEITVTVDPPIEGVVRMLQAFPQLTMAEIRTASIEGLAQAQDFLGKYPPQVSATYRRTGTLGRSWVADFRQTKDSYNAILSNPIRYARFVQDENFQTNIHRGRWPSIQMLTRAAGARIRRRFEAIPKNVMKAIEAFIGGS